MFSDKKKLSKYLSWFAIALTGLSIIGIIILSITAFSHFPPLEYQENPVLKQAEARMLGSEIPHEEVEASALLLLGNYTTQTAFTYDMMQSILLVLVSALILTLLIIAAQIYMWSLDRRRLAHWKRAGFVCERLEFLPANRVKLNGIELELNRKQIENLLEFTKKRQCGENLYSHDLGDHGAQSIKRLREEIGSKFIEKTLIKVRKSEGYWIEVHPDRIYDSRA